jgi:hypothetical protein
LDLTDTEKQSAREPPSCLNTKNCDGEKHFFLTVPTLKNTRLLSSLSDYTKKRDADKKMANLKTLGYNRAKADNRDGQTSYIAANILGVKITVLAEKGLDYSDIPRSVVKNARKRGVLPARPM